MSHSSAIAMTEYSFLVAFARDGHLHSNELAMLERLALGDGDPDDEERKVLRNIFAHARAKGVSERVEAEIQHFCERYGI